MKFNRLTGNIGAEVVDFQLCEISDSSFSEVAELLWEHQVLVFRRQEMTASDHVALGRRFGELHWHPNFPGIDEHPEVLAISNWGKDKTITEVWHSDVSCDDEPPSVSILRAIHIPSYGGDTMWSNQYAAWDSLSESMQRMIAPLRAVHENYDIRSSHPVARTHPETGRKALYVNDGFTRHFEGMSVAESRPLLRYLVDVGSSLDLTMRHSWQPGDLVMWDNRCVMHFAIHDYGDAQRDMHRVTVRGEKPV